MTIKKFSFYLTIILLILLPLAYLSMVGLISGWDLYVSLFPVILNYFTTLLSFVLIKRTLQSNPNMLMAGIMGAMLLKMMVGVISLLYVGLALKSALLYYSFVFVTSYVVFAAFEIPKLMELAKKT